MPSNYENSAAAAKAARMISSPCTVVLSVNMDTHTFEARCYGHSAAFQDMAIQMAEAALAGVDAVDPIIPA